MAGQQLSVLDKFSNRVTAYGTISLTNGTYSTPNKISTQWNPKDKMGIVIHKTRWHFDSTILNLDAATDQFAYGLCLVASQPTSGFQVGTPGVFEYNYCYTQYGTLVGMGFPKRTVENDWTMLKGGGLLCHPASLYTWTSNLSTAAWANTVAWNLEIYYELVALSPEDWQEMWQLGYITTTI